MPARRHAALCRLRRVARALPESALPAAIHRELFEAMTFCLPPGEQCLGYPVAGPDNDLRAGQRRYNIVWYRPADEASEIPRLLTDENGVRHAISIPPPLIRGEAIAAMRAAAERLLAPQLRDIVRLIEEPILQPIYDLASPRLAFGRVAIIGDAAFVARPHVAAGVSKAADDAAALARRSTPTISKPRCAVSRRSACRKQKNHRAGAASRRLSAGDAERRRARPLRPPRHSRSRARRNRGARFFVRVNGWPSKRPGCSTRLCKNQVVTSSRKLAAVGLAATKLGIELFEIRNDRCERHVGKGAAVLEIFHVAPSGLIEGMEQTVIDAVEVERRDLGALAQRLVEGRRAFDPFPVDIELRVGMPVECIADLVLSRREVRWLRTSA